MVGGLARSQKKISWNWTQAIWWCCAALHCEVSPKNGRTCSKIFHTLFPETFFWRAGPTVPIPPPPGPLFVILGLGWAGKRIGPLPAGIRPKRGIAASLLWNLERRSKQAGREAQATYAAIYIQVNSEVYPTNQPAILPPINHPDHPLDHASPDNM